MGSESNSEKMILVSTPYPGVDKLPIKSPDWRLWPRKWPPEALKNLCNQNHDFFSEYRNVPPQAADLVKPYFETYQQYQDYLGAMTEPFVFGFDWAAGANPEANMPITFDHMGATAMVESGVAFARKTGEWVVIVCSDNSTHLLCSHVLSAVIPQNSRFSGRTAVLDRGRVSVATLSDDVFVPDGTPFAVTFVGALAIETRMEITKWLSKASYQFHLQTQ